MPPNAPFDSSTIVSPGSALRVSSSKMASTEGFCRAKRPRFESACPAGAFAAAHAFEARQGRAQILELRPVTLRGRGQRCHGVAQIVVARQRQQVAPGEYPARE